MFNNVPWLLSLRKVHISLSVIYAEAVTCVGPWQDLPIGKDEWRQQTSKGWRWKQTMDRRICLYFATSYQSCFICQMTAATYKLQNQTPWWNKTCRPNTNVLLADTIVFYKWWVVWIHHWPILTNFLGGHPLQPEPPQLKYVTPIEMNGKWLFFEVLSSRWRCQER